MQAIAIPFEQELNNALAIGGTEPQIIHQFVTNVAALQGLPGNVQINTAFVHQRPYAFVKTPQSICNRIKCELGDVLLVYKSLLNNQVQEHRATFLQAKKKGGTGWHVEPHQLEFLHNVGTIAFEFGRSVYHRAGYAPITFSSPSWPDTWSHYLCLESQATLVYSSDRVDNQYNNNCATFAFFNEPCVLGALQCQQCDSFLNFIDTFTSASGPGMDVVGVARQLLDIVFKRVGMILDPEEEWKGFWLPIDPDRVKGEKEGFGVIQIIVNEEEQPHEGLRSTRV